MCKLNLATCLLIICCYVDICDAQVADPTRPLGHSDVVSGGTGSASDGVRLMSILIGVDRKVAIINGQTLHENQKMKGVDILVKKIETDAVTLQQGNKIWRVSLNTTVIRK